MFLARWPETSPAYHRYIAKKDSISSSCYPFPKEEENTKYKVEIVTPPLEIFPNKPPEPHKRLILKRIPDDDITIYKIGDNIIKKINIGDYIYEYIINNKYRLKTTDNLSDDGLISLLFID